MLMTDSVSRFDWDEIFNLFRVRIETVTDIVAMYAGLIPWKFSIDAQFIEIKDGVFDDVKVG